MKDLESILDTLETVVNELPEIISLDDVKHHPALAKLVLLADRVCVDYRALEWVKSQ